MIISFGYHYPCPSVWDSTTSTASIPEKEESVIFLQKRGILHSQRFCHDGNEMNLILDNKLKKGKSTADNYSETWKCMKPGCRNTKELKVDTWLHGEHSTYANVICFIYYWSKELATLSVCQKELGMKDCAVIRWHNYLTEICATDLLSTCSRIGGCGMTVEVDEGMFVRRNRYSRSTAEEIGVIGGICKETKEYFMVQVKESNALALVKALEKWVKPGTTIVGDLLDEIRKKIKRKDDRAKYCRLMSSNSFIFPDSKTGIHKIVEDSSWSYAKSQFNTNLYSSRRTGGKGYSTKQLLCQFIWRSKIKRDKLDPFDTIIEQIAKYYGPNTYAKV